MGNLHGDQYTFYIVSCSILSSMKNVSDKSCRENQNTFYVQSILSNTMPFSGQATDDNMAHVVCVLDTEGYKHTLRICNTNCCRMATSVA